MSLIAEKDCQLATKFWASLSDVGGIMEKYPEAWNDAELCEDWVFLGCYLHYRESGVDHSLAAMQACRRGPHMKGSDRAFMEGQRRKMEGSSDDLMRDMVKMAKGAGIKTQGRFYMAGLADRRGYRDPGAWVSSIDDVKRVCRERNYECRGIVEHRADERPPAPKKAIAEDIVTELAAKALGSDTELRHRVREGGRKAYAALREQIAAKHARKTKSGTSKRH